MLGDNVDNFLRKMKLVRLFYALLDVPPDNRSRKPRIKLVVLVVRTLVFYTVFGLLKLAQVMVVSTDTRKRMNIMVETNDGFRIAEADLALRGPGDLEGTLQSGTPFNLQIANLATDGQLVTLARQAALDILDKDPMLEDEMNRIYKRRLDTLRIEAHNWSEIS